MICIFDVCIGRWSNAFLRWLNYTYQEQIGPAPNQQRCARHKRHHVDHGGVVTLLKTLRPLYATARQRRDVVYWELLSTLESMVSIFVVILLHFKNGNKT